MMIKKPRSFKESTWLRRNIRYAIVGILVGGLMSVFIGLFNTNGIEPKMALLNILFSLFITLSITNIIGLVLCYFSPNATNFWKFILIYYGCNLIGMVLGMELSHGIVALIFDVKYQFLAHSGDYKFTSFSTLVIGTLILFYHFQRVNAEAQLKAKEMELLKLSQLKTQVELQALQAKINPHFLYNALNSIVSLIHDDADKAEEMTMKLSKLFRYSINTMQENFCAISEEIEMLHTYLAIEKVRFGNRIDFKIDCPPIIESKAIPRFLLQPLVENALKHGLKDKQENGLLEVTFSEEAGIIKILVCDNGVPFPKELTAGYGLQSTSDKLQLLYKENYELQFLNTPFKHIKIAVPIT